MIAELPLIESTTKRVIPQFESSPNLSNLVNLLDANNTDAVDIKKYQEPLREFLISGEIISIFNTALSGLIYDPRHTTANFENNGFCLFENDKFKLVMETVHSPPGVGKMMASAPSSTMFGVVGSGELEFDIWKFKNNIDMSVFDPNAGLEKLSKQRITNSGDLAICETNQIPFFSSNQKITIIKLIERHLVPYQWVIDVETLTPLFIRASLASVSRNTTLIDIIKDFSGGGRHCSEFKDVLLELKRHPFHFVRWKAIQVLFDIDQAAGRDALAEAVNDSHPHVSHAAAESMRILQIKHED